MGGSWHGSPRWLMVVIVAQGARAGYRYFDIRLSTTLPSTSVRIAPAPFDDPFFWDTTRTVFRDAYSSTD